MVGTRRSARSALFTPTATRTRSAAKYDYKWLSTGRSAPSGSEDDGKVFHTSFARIKRAASTSLPGSSSSSSESDSGSSSESEAERGGSPTPNAKASRKVEVQVTPTKSKTTAENGTANGAVAATKAAKAGKAAAKKKTDESRFAIGDGVQVAVEGGKEGVGVLVGLWEEPIPDEEEEEEPVRGGRSGRGKGGVGRGGATGRGVKEDEVSGDVDPSRGTRMMARIHWFFRRQDLPGVMRNLSLEDNEVLLAASPTRPVTTDLPLSLLTKTVPIYSRAVFKEQFPDEERQTKWKGWSYVRKGVYWCDRAYDMGARGGKVFKVDIDAWKGRGRTEGVWDVALAEVAEKQSEDEASSDEDEGSVASAGEESGDDDEEMDVDVDEAEEEDDKPKRKRRTTKATPAKKAKTTVPQKRKRKAAEEVKEPTRRRRAPHAKASPSRLPPTVEVDTLPTDPYERALRLLHVGATPESLPCREEEFVDVLSRVEEGIEGGGGGCLYIAGVPGTGKTATVHAVVKELKRKAEDGELAPFSYVEINGLKIPSPQHAYTILWETLSGQQGCSAKTALRGLEAHFGRKTGAGGIGGVRGPRGHTFVVLMDELDQLLTTKQDVVYNFFNWPTLRDSQLFVIAIANRMDLPQQLAAKIKSRLGLQTLLFQPYDRASLVEIVQSRLIPHPRSTEDHKVLTPDAITLAATKMAGTNGDARRVLDACRRAVEVAMGASDGTEDVPTKTTKANDTTNKANGTATGTMVKERRPVTARDMVAVLNAMSSSPVAMYLKTCSVQQKMLLAALVRCVRREGVPEITWRALRQDHDALTRALLESNDLLSDAELGLVRSSLVATHALTAAPDNYRSMDDRRLALGMEIGEVGRVLMNEGDGWRRALAGV